MMGGLGTSLAPASKMLGNSHSTAASWLGQIRTNLFFSGLRSSPTPAYCLSICIMRNCVCWSIGSCGSAGTMISCEVSVPSASVILNVSLISIGFLAAYVKNEPSRHRRDLDGLFKLFAFVRILLFDLVPKLIHLFENHSIAFVGAHHGGVLLCGPAKLVADQFTYLFNCHSSPNCLSVFTPMSAAAAFWAGGLGKI